MAKLTYSDIYEEIVEFYPLGIKASDPRYSEYPGLVLMQDLSHKKIEPALYKKWKSFVSTLEFPNCEILQASPESVLFDPCYTGRFLLLKEKTGKATFKRELIVHLSVLGPYYSIYGMDKISMNIDGGDEPFDPIVYVSPHGFFTPFFPVIRNKIEDVYKEAKFVPYSLLRKEIPSIYVSGGKSRADRYASVFQALFIPEDVTNYNLKGDIYYE